MLNLIKKLAITDGTNVVQLDNIMSGVDGASTFGYSLTPTAVQVNDNQRQQYKFTHQLDVRTLDPTSADRVKLAVMEANQSTVQVSGIGVDGFLALSGRLTRTDQYDEIVSDRFLITKDAPAGYNPGYYSGDNRFADTDILNGSWTGTNPAGSLSFSGTGQITMTRLSTGNFPSSFATIFFPFEGETVTFSVDVASFIGASGGILRIDQLDAAMATLSATTSAITSTGINSLSVTLSANTVYLNFRIGPDGVIGDNLVFSKRMFARGVNTTFTL